MSQWLVIETFRGKYCGDNWNLQAGEVIDDTQVPVDTLAPFGLAVVPYGIGYRNYAHDAYLSRYSRADRRRGNYRRCAGTNI